MRSMAARTATLHAPAIDCSLQQVLAFSVVYSVMSQLVSEHELCSQSGSSAGLASF